MKVSFFWLEANREKLRARNAEALIHAVMISCQIKANVVENDEKEQGLRALLNLGHTFGHAIETLAGYGVVKHGEAVSIGIVMAAKLSHDLHMCSNSDVDRIVNLLSFFGLPVNPPDFTAREYLGIMQRDKKVKNGQIRVILNQGLGAASIHTLPNFAQHLENLLTG